MNELEVGDRRKFSASAVGESRKDKDFEIAEVLEKPEISMEWRWDTGICPHCKKRLVRNIIHDFYRIEILVPSGSKKDSVKVSDIVILGDTMDKRRMVIPSSKEAFKEVLEKSEKFKELAKKVT